MLRLLQQSFGLHRGLDAVEHDADAGGQLFQKHQVRRSERVQRRQPQHRLELTLEYHREHHDAAGQSIEEYGIDRYGVGRHFGYQNAPHVCRTLTEKPLAQLDP